MENIFKKKFAPNKVLILFVFFAISIIFLYTFFDYTYKKLKMIITLIYFFPGIIFFSFISIYNIKKYSKSDIKIKLVILFPLLVIILYIMYIIGMLLYAMIYR